ncbi:MAG: undecaprenyl-diphosphate phosphatase [Candidatus Izemoplasmatales bacterium]|jgi:undecaprenyl-diphosphatase|nr:undecaprenyl-diphosphate phosphatase [Candidatus Izemoplasmatales bacterium]
MEILIELIKYIIFGIVQGVTEVLPVSSRGHVLFLDSIFRAGIGDNDFFVILLNLGSMIAVIYFLRKDVKLYFKDFYKYVIKKDRSKEIKHNYNYLRNVFIGIIPIFIVGATVTFVGLKDYSESISYVLIGLGALATATILFIVRNQMNEHVNKDVTSKSAFFIGVMQVLSVFPGLSRLGITTAAGVNRRLSMDSALKFAFMMFIPISIGAILSQFIAVNFDFSILLSDFIVNDIWTYFYYIISFIVSIFATYYSLKWVFIWFRKGKLTVFYLYNLLFGLIAIAYGLII